MTRFDRAREASSIKRARPFDLAELPIRVRQDRLSRKHAESMPKRNLASRSRSGS